MTAADIAIIVVCCVVVIAVVAVAIVRKKKGKTSCGCGDCASCTACRHGADGDKTLPRADAETVQPPAEKTAKSSARPQSVKDDEAERAARADAFIKSLSAGKADCDCSSCDTHACACKRHNPADNTVKKQS